jgi:NADPH-dependent 2,4-dienoyl-CoA reductase/sulfur reductase-like enzyme/rhodanese-related sulfurtransferase
MKIVVIGGVAGGASAAAKARRMDERAEIVLFERGQYISFANCGLPYHVGKVIPQRDSLLVMTPRKLSARTSVDVRTLSEVTAIDRGKRVVRVHNLNTGETYDEPYDKLIISTGSTPVRPPIPGADDSDVMQLWTIPDMDRVVSRIDEGARKAVVVGAGFIGLEVAENLVERGLQVDLVEMMDQVLPTLDREMAQPLADELTGMGITLHNGRKCTEIERSSEVHTPDVDLPRTSEHDLALKLDDGTVLAADFVLLSVGIRPNSELARDAGLELNQRGGIVVNERLETSDPSIYAVGDVASIRDLVTGQQTLIPLAGPANRQGRTAAINACGGDAKYAGSLGTAVVKVGGLAAASAGKTERALGAAGIGFRKIYYHGASHASYYPGASPLAIKLLFREDGGILGCQVVGRDGADKRIDVIATAMKTGLTVYDLEDLELAYAPPYGSAKDPVNFVGMAAANALRGETTPVHCEDIPQDALLLDVREPAETDQGVIPGAKQIPLGQLRGRMAELPRDRRIVVYCKAGLRGYLGERILLQNGFDAANLSGGWLTWKAFNP